MVLGSVGDNLENIALRVLVFCLLTLGGSWVLKRVMSHKSWVGAYLFTALFYAMVYKIASFIPEISTYPLSLGWSEVSRYFYASLFFSSRIYGVSVPSSVLHPSRYLMQSLPFILSDLPLWFHRFWQVFLWILFTFGVGLSLIRRLNPSPQENNQSDGKLKRLWQLGFVLWVFLFLFQGPVYYHLSVIVVFVLLGFNRHRLWLTLVVVLIASAWAGISRINWIPVPGLMAAVLFMLETPIGDKRVWRYLTPPLLWTVLGSITALLSQQVYVLLSGNPAEYFGSSFSSDLLWYRLLPNTTYRLGILFNIGLVSLPLVILIFLRLYQRWRDYHLIRLLGLASILLVLFMGGIVVSVKIGGGSNLHNLDAYLVLLLVIGSYIYFTRFPDENGQYAQLSPRLWAAVSFAVAVPVIFTLSSGGQVQNRDFDGANKAIKLIQEVSSQVVKTNDEVLFITQRHLLTFNDVEKVSLVPDYELVFLMEMAMAGNEAYLEKFHNDIANQRFAVIISGPLVIQYQGRYHQFGEENDAWVKLVSEPVLCNYEPSVTLRELALQILVPRDEPCQ
jgi:hypothetical protein